MFILCFLLSLGVVSPCFSEIEVEVQTLKSVAPLHHFWESTGLCPPLPHQNASRYLLSDDMKQNLLLASSVPHGGLKQVRIHWLLELVSLENGSYNFTNLDELVKFLYENKLKPGFEIMGNPSNAFSDFDNVTQVMQLEALVKAIAVRYIKLHGLAYVRKWNFETWNEPDNEDFDNVKITVDGFVKYYDACRQGLSEADTGLTFGGPGGACRQKHSPRCWALLDHCAKSAQPEKRIDFIAIHQKGKGKAENILNAELDACSNIHNKYPSLKSVPLFNDEADPLVGWNKPEWWRADVTYAAVIAKVIGQHQNKILANSSRSDLKYTLLSNDNGFLSFSPHFFTQRTLNARFQINNTDPKYVHFIKKPSLSVMALLSKLGDEQVSMNFSYNNSGTVGGIASVCNSCNNSQASVLLYNSADTSFVTDFTDIQLSYPNLTKVFKMVGSAYPPRAMSCQLNNFQTNPYSLWKDMGSPVFPTADQLQMLHRVEGPHCTTPKDINLNNRGVYQTKIVLPLPGVFLQQICSREKEFLGKPTGLRAHMINFNQTLIVWRDENLSKCIQTYNIQYAAKGKTTFVTINSVTVLFTSYTFISHEKIEGSFRAQAVDFWDRKGPFSETIQYPFSN